MLIGLQNEINVIIQCSLFTKALHLLLCTFLMLLCYFTYKSPGRIKISSKSYIGELMSDS